MRSSWKPVYLNSDILFKYSNSNELAITSAATLRTTCITPSLVHSTLVVHNGKFYTSLYVTQNMIGHKVGEFVPTKKRSIMIHAKLLSKLKAQKAKKVKKKK